MIVCLEESIVIAFSGAEQRMELERRTGGKRVRKKESKREVHPTELTMPRVPLRSTGRGSSTGKSRENRK
jgi:hypothetical protein